MAAEFARENPITAGRLALDKEGKEVCGDPYVERLLEGFAYLTARVQVKLDAEFPRLTQALLETVYPQYLCPIPSMAMVRLEPDPQATPPEGYAIPRGSVLRSIPRSGERTACEFRTAQEMQLLPLRIAEARYFTRDVSQLELPPELRCRAALRLRLQSTNGLPIKALQFDRLPIVLRGADETPGSIYEQIFARGRSVIVQAVTADRQKPRKSLPIEQAVRRVGFRDEEALLPVSPRGFQGHRLLREYFAFPQRFLFVEFMGLAEALQLCEGEQFDLIVTLSEAEVRLEERRIDASFFELFCTPIVNLFPKRTDRILMSDRFSEFQVIADKTRTLDFEIFEVQSVTGYGVRSDEEHEFRPFYLAKDTDTRTGAFFTVNRVPRVLSEREKKFGSKSGYIGSEVYLSLVDSSAAPYRSGLQQLGVMTLCTNRHLPLQVPYGGTRDFSMEIAAPFTAITCLTKPTAPRPAHADGELGWRIISQLSLNYLSLLDGPADSGALALRQLLKLYADRSDEILRQQIEGVRSVQSRSVVQRVQAPGPITFARGLEISVLFDESAYEGFGCFILGTVLEQFFARYVSLNSFTETVIKSQQRGDIIRWKPQIGRRQLI